MDTWHEPESFRGLLLRHRGRTGLLQRDLVARARVSRGAVQDWEAGVSYPTAERLQTLIQVLLEAGGLTAEQEASEARELWAAAEREAPRMHTPFDEEWFARLLAAHATPTQGRVGEALRAVPAAAPGPGGVNRAQDWGEAPDTVGFVGRADELARLRRWVLDERCRLLAVLGRGGIGKTCLAAKLGQEVAPSFERVYWRSLRDAPPMSDWLAGAVAFLSDQQLAPPSADSERIAVLLHLLRERRCLLVLDNSETLLEPGQREGGYREGMAGYGRVLQAVGGASHESCLVLTSREAPPELPLLNGAVRTLQLRGFGVPEAQVLLAYQKLNGTSQQWGELNARYGGNGLALKVVGETIRELFGGHIGTFLQEAGDGNVFGGIRRLLAEQVDRGSALEHQVLRLLAIDREPVSIGRLVAEVGPSVDRTSTLEAVEALLRRSLVERTETPGAAVFTLQSVVLEYVSERLVVDVCNEVQRGQPVLLVEQPLVHAQAKDHVRQTQERLIGQPILQQLAAQYDERETEQRLITLLEGWRGRSAEEQGYGPGNVVNLLRLLRCDLRRLPLYRLSIRQAYVQGTEAQDASLAGTRLAETVLGDAFGAVVAVALSADGTRVAAGTLGGEVHAWRVADRTTILVARGHVGAVWSVALSADGRLLASGGDDGRVLVWDVAGSRLLATMEGHVGGIWSVAMDADGRLIASGGYDRTVRLWQVSPGGDAGCLIAELEGHAEAVRWVALTGDGRVLASGGNDGMVHVWEIRPGPDGTPRVAGQLAVFDTHAGVIFGLAVSGDGRRVATAQSDGLQLWEVWPDADGTVQCTGPALLRGHAGRVFGVGLSTDGRLVASGGSDGTVRLWEAESCRPLAILEGHSGTVHGVALSGDGRLAASGSDDCSVRLWDAEGGRPLAVLEGQAGAVYAVALAADGRLLASGTDDGGVRLWQVESGRPLTFLEGRAGAVYAVALSADGRLLASATDDGGVRLWEVESGRPITVLDGRAGAVHSVALSADGRLLASGENDGTVRLWEVPYDGALPKLLAAIKAHNAGAYTVALSADGRLVASGGDDGVVRVWEVAGGRLLASLEGNDGVVFSVALSGDGRLVASGGLDGVLRLWAADGGSPLAMLEGHRGAVFGVTLSGNGRLLASGGEDGAPRLWDVVSHHPLGTLTGHDGIVRAVALTADGGLLASGSLDGTVKLWDTRRRTLLRTLRPDRRFERLDITGLSGVTAAQRAALLALGAIEQHAPASEPTARLSLESSR